MLKQLLHSGSKIVPNCPSGASLFFFSLALIFHSQHSKLSSYFHCVSLLSVLKSREMRIQRAISFDTFRLAAISLFFGHRPDQNVRSLPFHGDFSPFGPKIRHFSLLQKSKKADSVEEVTALSEDSIWLPSYVPNSSPFSHFHNKQNSALCHCQSTEILVQAINTPIFSRFSTEKQMQTKKK